MRVQSICDNSITYGTINMKHMNEIKIPPPTTIVSDCIIIGSTLFIPHNVESIEFGIDIYIAIEIPLLIGKWWWAPPMWTQTGIKKKKPNGRMYCQCKIQYERKKSRFSLMEFLSI